MCFNQDTFVKDILYSKHLKDLLIGTCVLSLKFQIIKLGEMLFYSFSNFFCLLISHPN